MAHRIYRISLSPEQAPEVKRVLDFDGKSSLEDLHRVITQHYAPDVGDKLYGFFLSGRAWDKATAYLDPRAEGRRTDKALLFRLGLRVGQTIAHVVDFKTERHYVATILAVREADKGLAEPVLVESVGEAPVAGSEAEEQPASSESAPRELGVLVALAEAFLDADDQLEPFAELFQNARLAHEPWEVDALELSALRSTGQPSSAILVGLAEALLVLNAVAIAAERLLEALAGDLQQLWKVDEWLLERSCLARLLELPTELALAGELERAVRLTEQLRFVDRELMDGDRAVLLARAGRTEEALAQVDENLSRAQDAVLVELKAGDVHRALRDSAAAEAYYRRALSLAKTPSDKLQALLRVASTLVDAGRDAEAAELLQQARLHADAATPSFEGVSRNDPCPCGSGKKFKKCHGA